jgi:hypothetical protein
MFYYDRQYLECAGMILALIYDLPKKEMLFIPY